MSYVFVSLPKPSANPYSFKPSSKTRIINADKEIRVCFNRSCNSLGSRQTLQVLYDLAPSNFTVRSCGCLGRCGAGPNLAVLPEGVIIGHCGTAARATSFLADLCGEDKFDSSKSLEALALRKEGEAEMEKGRFSEADDLLSQVTSLGLCLVRTRLKLGPVYDAIDAKPSGGLHIIYKCRSAARLAMGNYSSALQDAEAAARIAPEYPEAYICQGDVFLAMDEFDQAETAYSSVLEIDPSLRRSRSFKARIAKLQQKLTATNVPS